MNKFIFFLLAPLFCLAHSGSPEISINPNAHILNLEVQATLYEDGKEMRKGTLLWYVPRKFKLPVREALHAGAAAGGMLNPFFLLFHLAPYFVEPTPQVWLTSPGLLPIDLRAYAGIEKLLQMAISRESFADDENPFSFDREVVAVEIFSRKLSQAGVAYAPGELPYVYDVHVAAALRVGYRASSFGYRSAEVPPYEVYGVTQKRIAPLEECPDLLALAN